MPKLKTQNSPEVRKRQDAWEKGEKMLNEYFQYLVNEYDAKVPYISSLLDADSRLNYSFELYGIKKNELITIIPKCIETLNSAKATATMDFKEYQGNKQEYVFTNIM